MLNNRTAIINGEGLNSYLYRLARLNYFENINFFITKMKVEPRSIENNDFDEKLIEEINRMSGVPVSILSTRSCNNYRTEWGDAVFQRVKMKTTVKFCPCCISQCLHHKNIWNIAPVTVCLEHASFLVDKCMNCGGNIRLCDLMKGHCKYCGFEYTQSVGQHVDPDTFDYYVQERLQAKIGEVVHFSDDFLLNLSFADLMTLSHHTFYLLRGLKSYVINKNHILKPFSNAKKGKYDNINCHISYANVYWVYDKLTGEQANFQKMIRDVRLSMLKKRAIFWFRYEQLFMEKQFQFLEQVYKKTKTQLESELPSNCNNKNFEMTTVSERKEKVFCSAKYTESTAPEYKRDDFFRRDEVASLLGFGGSRQHINSLINVGYLKLIKSPDHKFFVHRDDLEGFIERLGMVYLDNKDNIQNGISVYDAFNLYGKYGFKLLTMVQFIVNKKITLYATNNTMKIGNMFFDKTELEKVKMILINERQQLKGYTMNEISKMFHIDRQTIHLMIEKELLKPLKIIDYNDGRKNYFFNKVHVDAFRENHLFITEAMEEFELKYKKINSWINEGKLTDVFQGIRNKYLIKRSEIEELLKTTG
ncbi:TniQ family protein [Paenibacillus albus]|uniref:TniQ family protein n=1 Tax=Paenibacillus albus TaxID=2495582 RepID=UPI0013DFE15F|nr:TniQ family protein [Paenibacillus albus]